MSNQGSRRSVRLQNRRQQRLRTRSQPPARIARSRSRSSLSRRASTSRGSSRESSASGSTSTTGSSRKESAAVSIQGWYKKKKSITSTPTTTMSSTTTSKYDNLFASTDLDDDDIKQESSFLSEHDRGAKGSPELAKNYARATKGTNTKFITLKSLKSNNITTETEEDGVIDTADISIVFQQCGLATKQFKEICTEFDYGKMVEIPEYADPSKPATNGRWSNKTINLLENPTSVSLEHVKAYTSDLIRRTKADSTARQTQFWSLKALRDSVSGDLKTLVDDKFDVLPIDEQGGSVYLKLLFDIVYNMTEPVIRALHKWIKNFRRNGIKLVIDENVLIFVTTCKNICKRLDEIGQLPLDAVTDILEGLIKCSHSEFSDTFAHYRTLAGQSLLTVPSFKNKTVYEKVMIYLEQAQDLYIVYTVNGTWKFKFKSYYTGTGVHDLICFNCGKKGHGVRGCKEPRDQARIDKNLAEFREKKKSQGNFRNNRSGGQAGGGYQRRTFTKTTGDEKVNNITEKSITNNKSKKKGKKAGELGEAPPKDPTPMISLAQLGEHMQKMVTLSSDPNQAAVAQMVSDLCQGKV